VLYSKVLHIVYGAPYSLKRCMQFFFLMCHQYIEPRNFSEIHFFGDKVDKGGNDYEIFEDPRTIGHRVEGPHDTLAILNKVFGIEI